MLGAQLDGMLRGSEPDSGSPAGAEPAGGALN